MYKEIIRIFKNMLTKMIFILCVEGLSSCKWIKADEPPVALVAGTVAASLVVVITAMAIIVCCKRCRGENSNMK